VIPPRFESAKERRPSGASSLSISRFEGYITRSRREKRRGKIFMALSVLFVLATWALFFGTAVSKINEKKTT